jgi:putative ABC transport system substrate-binding protein
MKAFEQSLAEQGYVADKTIRLETRHTAGRGDRLLNFAVELAAAKVDVIVVWSSAGALAAQQATRTIPIVFVSVTAPEKIGLVQSVARPGGNITGVAFTASEATYSKTLEILQGGGTCSKAGGSPSRSSQSRHRAGNRGGGSGPEDHRGASCGHRA